jgi:hypothetical protein
MITATITIADHVAPHGMAAGMCNSERREPSLNQRFLLTQLEQSLDQADALQSLELQRLRLLIERQQLQLQPQVTTLSCGTVPHRTSGGDIVIRLRRAA